MRLVSTFRSQVGLRTDRPLLDDEIRAVAPSIFAVQPHESRSARYTCIPTGEVLGALRKEGFEPFMVCQTKVRNESKREHTKHMIRLRHSTQITGDEANEIILLNSHDGSSSYQMLAGVFRFVCSNGMVCGDTAGDVRVRHQGTVVNDVIEGAYAVLDNFDKIDQQCEGMKAITLNMDEQYAYAKAALDLRYGDSDVPPPVTESQLLRSRRFADDSIDLWTTFNRVQENLIRGGLSGRTANGKRTRTRAVTGIDQNLKLNRALWTLTEEMKRIKS